MGQVIGPIKMEDWKLLKTLHKTIPYLESQDSRVYSHVVEVERRIYKDVRDKYTIK